MWFIPKAFVHTIMPGSYVKKKICVNTRLGGEDDSLGRSLDKS